MKTLSLEQLHIKVYGFDMHIFYPCWGNNDWNILEHYNPFVVKFLQSVGSNVKCMVNWNENVRYYLFVDGIYRCQLIFVQMIHEPHPRKKKLILLPHISIVGKMLNVCLKCYSFTFTLLPILVNNVIIRSSYTF
jgi:hypothetical protein